MIIFIIGFLLVYGSVGAIECGTIDFFQFIIQNIIGMCCMLLACHWALRKKK